MHYSIFTCLLIYVVLLYLIGRHWNKMTIVILFIFLYIISNVILGSILCADYLVNNPGISCDSTFKNTIDSIKYPWFATPYVILTIALMISLIFKPKLNSDKEGRTNKNYKTATKLFITLMLISLALGSATLFFSSDMIGLGFLLIVVLGTIVSFVVSIATYITLNINDNN